ncbi:MULTISPECIES: DUF4236 domain-containing protein [Streptomyces]|uniref:DUF4236 domain-containing protein n=1 Tax=Streptomyces TaxID=1883 RepID=UPI001D158E3F|nr:MULTISPECIES: DUF4236 domain-containing protein [Streptomyces]MCC3655659.1 DUF4236 domain-containing protein [Streptomyces sp. S07_1.15]WSQ70028.1 DUF4236 domain-containing protein [Streptomyces xinghaiensis]
MPVTFRKSFRILPGVRLNLNRRSMSVTFGSGKGPKRTYSTSGRTTTSHDLPGPFGYRKSTRRGGH